MKIRILSILLLLVLLLTACKSTQDPDKKLDPDYKQYMEAMENKCFYGDFHLDQVFVLMTNEASLQFIDYTPEHFSDVGCVAVLQEMNKDEKEQLQAALNGEKVDKEYNSAEYNAYLLLQIEGTDQEGIFRAITALESRTDVKRASPNFLFSGEDMSGEKRPAEQRWKDISFANNAIIVRLTNAASVQMLDYNPADFAEIGCIKVVEWNPALFENARGQLRGETEYKHVNLETYTRSLILYLGEQTRENVFRALTAMEQRADIEAVRPNLTADVLKD